MQLLRSEKKVAGLPSAFQSTEYCLKFGRMKIELKATFSTLGVYVCLCQWIFQLPTPNKMKSKRRCLVWLTQRRPSETGRHRHTVAPPGNVLKPRQPLVVPPRPVTQHERTQKHIKFWNSNENCLPNKKIEERRDKTLGEKKNYLCTINNNPAKGFRFGPVPSLCPALGSRFHGIIQSRWFLSFCVCAHSGSEGSTWSSTIGGVFIGHFLGRKIWNSIHQ